MDNFVKVNNTNVDHLTDYFKTTDFAKFPELREKFIDRIDVLDKVKNLMLLPLTECMTVTQIADFYEVHYDTVKACYDRHKKEIKSDGVCVMTPNEYKQIFNAKKVRIKDSKCNFNVEQLHGKMVVYIDGNTTITIPNRGITVFPLRAVLRIGMFLRDSKVAEEIRTQLLNVVEETRTVNPELLTKQIDQEEQLYLNVVRNMMNGNRDAMFGAVQDLVDYQNRYKLEMEKRIDTLTTDKKILTNEIVTISDRSSANRAVRCLANKIHKPYQAVWNSIYSHLKYKYSIDLKKRGAKPYLSHMKTNEWDTLQKTIAAIVEENGFDSKQFFEDCKTLSDIT